MKKILPLLFLLFSVTIFAQRTDTIARPKLIVNIAIDGLRSDYISLFWNNLDAHGFRRLIREGNYCKNMTFPYMTVGNAADYASAVTGTLPSEHGICGLTYWDKKTRTAQSFLYDADKKGINTSLSLSPKNIMTSTFSDELKLNTQGRAKIVTIALNADEAIVMAGHSGDIALWIDERTGEWATSSYYSSMLPSWAVKINSFNSGKSYAQWNWTNLYIPSYYKANSTQSLSAATFNYPLSTIMTDKNVPYHKFKESPFVNTMVCETALSALRSEYMGLYEVPDLLNLQFTVKGFNQTNTGVLTAETQDMYYRLDKDLRNLIDEIESICGVGNVLYVLYATQAEYTSPDYLAKYKIPSGYFVSEQAMSLLTSYLMSQYGQVPFIKGYSNQQIFLNTDAIEAKKLNIKEVKQKITEFMVRFEGVQYAFSDEDIFSNSYSNEYIRMAQNAYSKDKSGDIIIYLKPGWVAVETESQKIGVSSRVNNYVPFIVSGWRTKAKSITQPFSVVDIAPTICNMLSIPYPNASIGKAVTNVME